MGVAFHTDDASRARKYTRPHFRPRFRRRTHQAESSSSTTAAAFPRAISRKDTRFAPRTTTPCAVQKANIARKRRVHIYTRTYTRTHGGIRGEEREEDMQEARRGEVTLTPCKGTTRRRRRRAGICAEIYDYRREGARRPRERVAKCEGKHKMRARALNKYQVEKVIRTSWRTACEI